MISEILMVSHRPELLRWVHNKIQREIESEGISESDLNSGDFTLSFTLLEFSSGLILEGVPVWQQQFSYASF